MNQIFAMLDRSVVQDSATRAKLDALTQEIKKLQTEIEQLGEQGEVEKAEEANKKVQSLVVVLRLMQSSASRHMCTLYSARFYSILSRHGKC